MENDGLPMAHYDPLWPYGCKPIQPMFDLRIVEDDGWWFMMVYASIQDTN